MDTERTEEGNWLYYINLLTLIQLSLCVVVGPVEADPEYQLIVDSNNLVVEIDNEISEWDELFSFGVIYECSPHIFDVYLTEILLIFKSLIFGYLIFFSIFIWISIWRKSFFFSCSFLLLYFFDRNPFFS